ncbi:hypothetical protein [Novosphingobium sp.]
MTADSAADPFGGVGSVVGWPDASAGAEPASAVVPLAGVASGAG